MPTGDGLEPGFRGVGTALGVECSVVLEDSGLGDVPGVVRVLLLQVAVADLVVLGWSSWMMIDERGERERE